MAQSLNVKHVTQTSDSCVNYLSRVMVILVKLEWAEACNFFWYKLRVSVFCLKVERVSKLDFKCSSFKGATHGHRACSFLS